MLPPQGRHYKEVACCPDCAEFPPLGLLKHKTRLHANGAESQASWLLAWWLGNILVGLLACWALLSGFCFAGTLRFECVLARWLLDAGILGIFATRSQVYGAHGCHLACLVPLLWRPGGPWDDPGTILGRSWDIGGHKEGPCEVQAWILSIFC